MHPANRQTTLSTARHQIWGVLQQWTELDEFRSTTASEPNMKAGSTRAFKCCFCINANCASDIFTWYCPPWVNGHYQPIIPNAQLVSRLPCQSGGSHGDDLVPCPWGWAVKNAAAKPRAVLAKRPTRRVKDKPDCACPIMHSPCT